MLGVVLVGAALVRAYRLRTPANPVIFDETFYVNAVRIIRGLNVPTGLPYSGAPHGVDPNLEHPPLGKAFIDASMWAFGDNGFGWRLPSLLLGIASVVLVYAIVRRLSPDGWLAVLAATIFAFDNFVFVHSRIATLDMPMLTFMLLAVWLWFSEWHALAGIACGIALLIKLPALFGLAALVLLGLGPVVIRAVRERTLDVRALRPTVLLLLSSTVVFLGGLWLLDLAFTQYNTPFAHLRHMWDFGFAVTTRHGAASNTSKPWWWLINEVKQTYYNQGVKITVNGRQVGSRTDINFQGLMNPFVAGAAPLAVSYAAWRAWRLRDTLSVFVLVWITTNYLPYYPLVLIEQRTTYFYYIVPTVAAYAIAIAQLLREPRLPLLVTWGYMAMFFVGFVLYYPFRGVF
jgi:dolichyl-phosphate-mannose-protein mannosyltransferase